MLSSARQIVCSFILSLIDTARHRRQELDIRNFIGLFECLKQKLKSEWEINIAIAQVDLVKVHLNTVLQPLKYVPPP